jgi:hypothetical protein
VVKNSITVDDCARVHKITRGTEFKQDAVQVVQQLGQQRRHYATMCMARAKKKLRQTKTVSTKQARTICKYVSDKTWTR